MEEISLPPVPRPANLLLLSCILPPSRGGGSQLGCFGGLRVLQGLHNNIYSGCMQCRVGFLEIGWGRPILRVPISRTDHDQGLQQSSILRYIMGTGIQGTALFFVSFILRLRFLPCLYSRLPSSNNVSAPKMS